MWAEAAAQLHTGLLSHTNVGFGCPSARLEWQRQRQLAQPGQRADAGHLQLAGLQARNARDQR